MCPLIWQQVHPIPVVGGMLLMPNNISKSGVVVFLSLYFVFLVPPHYKIIPRELLADLDVSDPPLESVTLM